MDGLASLVHDPSNANASTTSLQGAILSRKEFQAATFGVFVTAVDSSSPFNEASVASRVLTIPNDHTFNIGQGGKMFHTGIFEKAMFVVATPATFTGRLMLLKFVDDIVEAMSPSLFHATFVTFL
jgi:hypothetical protein